MILSPATMQLNVLLSEIAILATLVNGVNILQTNDDGWAVANIRALNNDLIAAGYDVSTSGLTLREELLTLY